MKPTNLNPFFIDQILNYAHLVQSIEPITKNDFIGSLLSTYDMSTPQNHIFLIATQKSDFDTIRLSNDRQSLLFNH